MKKGMELPINTLVVFIIALVVLVAFIALFMNVQGQGGSSVSIETAKNSGCQRFVSMNLCKDCATETGSTITITSVKCPDGSLADNLETLAKNCYKKVDIAASATGVTPVVTAKKAACQLCCF